MEDVNAFAKVLTRTSPLTAEDVADLRDVFEFYHARDVPGGRIEARQAVRALRLLGLAGAQLNDAGGLAVQTGTSSASSAPKLFLTEPEFLMYAAQLFKDEVREYLRKGEFELEREQVAELRAARLFRSLDPSNTKRLDPRSARDGLHSLGTIQLNLDDGRAFCEHLMSFERALERTPTRRRKGARAEAQVEAFATEKEFVRFAAPVILPTVPASRVSYDHRQSEA